MKEKTFKRINWLMHYWTWNRGFSSSRFQIQRNRVNELKGLRKNNQRKDIQKKKLIDKLCENNINTVAEKFASSKTIHNSTLVFSWYCYCRKQTIFSLFTTNSRTNSSYSTSNFTRNILSWISLKWAKNKEINQLATVLYRKGTLEKNRFIKKKQWIFHFCCYKPILYHWLIDHVIR